MVLIYFPYRIWKARFLFTSCWYSQPGRDSEYRWNSFGFMAFPSPEISQWQYLTNDLGDARFMFESIPLLYGGVYLKVLKTYVNRKRLIVTPHQAHPLPSFTYKPQNQRYLHHFLVQRSKFKVVPLSTQYPWSYFKNTLCSEQCRWIFVGGETKMHR